MKAWKAMLGIGVVLLASAGAGFVTSPMRLAGGLGLFAVMLALLTLAKRRRDAKREKEARS